MSAAIIKDYEDETGKKAIRGGLFTKRFEKWNKKFVKAGVYDKIVFDNNLIYNRSTRRFVDKSKFFKNNGGVRARFNNADNVIDGDTILQPKVYVKNTVEPQIRKALQSRDALRTINIDMASINDNIEYVLRRLKQKEGKQYQIGAGNRRWALNSSTIGQISDLLKPDFVYVASHVSGKEILDAIAGDPTPK